MVKIDDVMKERRVYENNRRDINKWLYSVFYFRPNQYIDCFVFIYLFFFSGHFVQSPCMCEIKTEKKSSSANLSVWFLASSWSSSLLSSTLKISLTQSVHVLCDIFILLLSMYVIILSVFNQESRNLSLDRMKYKCTSNSHEHTV